MLTYQQQIEVLEAELSGMLEMFDSLAESDWARPTLLEPPPGKSPWTLRELAGHLDVSIGITMELLEDPKAGTADRDAVDFFVMPDEAPSEFYDYAFTMVEGRVGADMPSVLRNTFSQAVLAARAAPPDTLGEFTSVPYPLIRIDDWVSGRILEAVVHSMDVADVLDRPPAVTTEGITHAAFLLDELLALTGDARRPTELNDDVSWIRAAAGRDAHSDPRLPIIH